MRKFSGFLASFAAIAFVFATVLMPSSAQAAEFGDDWQPVKRQIDDGKYYLQDDVTYTRPMQVFGTATIDLNGHTIAFAPTGDNEGYLYIGPKAHVTIQDSEGGGKIVGGNGRTDTSVVERYREGGGIYIDTPSSSTAEGATLTMTGGTISNCSANLGGGVFVGRKATFTMAGGTIEGCSADLGGGVHVAASSSDGVVMEGGTFIMTGGTISDCTAHTFGGGVLVGGATGSMKMSGTAAVSGNHVDTGDGSGIGLIGASTMYADGGRVDGDMYLNTGTITRSAAASDYTTFNGRVKIQQGSVEDAAKLSVRFNGNGGSPQESVVRVLKGQALDSRPADPTRNGYLFTGWYVGGAAFDFDAAVTGSMDVDAGWTDSIADATVALDEDSFGYDGRPHSPAVTVSLPTGQLEEGTHYQLDGDVSATDAGNHTISVKGMGALKGSTEVTWTIEQADQTVSAQDVSTAYGETGAMVVGQGIGALSYEVVQGGDVVSVDRATGKLAILGVGNATVRVSAAGDVNHRAASTDVAVTVGKGTPRIDAWPTVSNLYVNEVIDEGRLEGGSASVDGSFSLVAQGESWKSAGRQQVEVAFSPADSDRYLALKQQVTVNVVRRTVERVVTEAPVVAGAKAGAPIGQLGLPATVTIATSGGKEFQVPVSWSGYDAEAAGRQVLAGTLDLSAVADEVQQATPEVTVTATVTLQASDASPEQSQAKGKAAADAKGSRDRSVIPNTADSAPVGRSAAVLLAAAACLALAARARRRA